MIAQAFDATRRNFRRTTLLQRSDISREETIVLSDGSIEIIFIDETLGMTLIPNDFNS